MFESKELKKSIAELKSTNEQMVTLIDNYFKDHKKPDSKYTTEGLTSRVYLLLLSIDERLNKHWEKIEELKATIIVKQAENEALKTQKEELNAIIKDQEKQIAELTKKSEKSKAKKK